MRGVFMARKNQIKTSDYKDFNALKQVPIEDIKADALTYFVRDKVNIIRSEPWNRNSAMSDLIEIFKRESDYWRIILGDNFHDIFVKTIAKKRWTTLRDDVLLTIDYEHYSAVKNIDGLSNWNIPPSSLVKNSVKTA
jgi:hypothetical protein